jgi:hypothetical protein
VRKVEEAFGAALDGTFDAENLGVGLGEVRIELIDTGAAQQRGYNYIIYVRAHGSELDVIGNEGDGSAED